MAAIIFTITSEGLTASLDAANTGLGLQLTHVSGHDAAGVEIGQWPLSGGIVEPNSNTLRFSSVMTSTTRKELYGLKLLGDSLVFATSVGASPLVVVDANIDFAPAFGLALESIPVGSITVSTDPNAPLAIILMLQHLGAANPHPQYTMKAVFDNHVGQNTLEHNNLLAMIQAVNQRVANLEIREEIQIGEFVITDDPRNPVLYKGYGSWRLVPDVLLKGLDFDGTVGQFSQVAAGSDQSVRTTFFWQRFDPSVIAPLRTISISADSTDVNLLVLFTATYGAPVIGERIKFVVESDVLVTASTTSNYAIVTGDWPPDSDVSMDVFGIVAGRGGDGGNGGNCHASFTGSGDRIVIPQDATNGGNGGPAILADSQAITILNNGVICGGGCGGGGGSARTAKTNAVQSFNNMGICGSGGGGGWPYGSGGNGGAIVNGSSESADRQGNSGANAGRLDSGDGGVSVSNFSTTGGNGGNGGSLGAVVNISDGGSGGGGTASASAGAGGLAGIAITGPVTVTGNPVLGR